MQLLLDVDISTRDPRWIGAWWLGFLVFGLTVVVFGIPLFFFPKHMKKENQVNHSNYKSDDDEEDTKPLLSMLLLETKGFLLICLKILALDAINSCCRFLLYFFYSNSISLIFIKKSRETISVLHLKLHSIRLGCLVPAH